MLHVNGIVPPVAVNVLLYCWNAVPSGANEAVVINKGSGALLMVKE
jgi:hypothetical protein